MKHRMKQNLVRLSDFVTAAQERYLMLHEETHSLRSLIDLTTKRSRVDQRLEWLDKLVKATRCQNQEAERRLAEVQQQLSKHQQLH